MWRRGVSRCELAIRRIGGLLRGPAQQRRDRTDSVDHCLLPTTLRRPSPERQHRGPLVVQAGQPACALQRDGCRRLVAEQDVSQRSPVVEEEAPPDRVGCHARAQRPAPACGQLGVALRACGPAGEPQLADPKASRPVAPRRGDPSPSLGLGVVGKAFQLLPRGVVDALEQPPPTVVPAPRVVSSHANRSSHRSPWLVGEVWTVSWLTLGQGRAASSARLDVRGSS
jgi:hypothetical protein